MMEAHDNNMRHSHHQIAIEAMLAPIEASLHLNDSHWTALRCAGIVLTADTVLGHVSEPQEDTHA
jgi:hypothetical protein